jgi:aspartate aminotransferase
MAAKKEVAVMAENLIGSEIIKLAADIREKINQGATIYNFTIGDFDPKIFPIPQALTQYIKDAYDTGETNYPPADGQAELRKSVIQFTEKYFGTEWADAEVVIASGSRPLIYAAYQCLIDAGDEVIFPVPSWNNNHYVHLTHAKPIEVETLAENHFLPTANDLRPHIASARMIALCSPLNPTGTMFSANQLKEICEMIVAENERRKDHEKPLFLLYDAVYNVLTFEGNVHVDPVSLCPAIKPYTVYIEGISKAFAATGVRVGWTFGPAYIISKMKSILGHIGAWAPKPEQIATAKFLSNYTAIDAFVMQFKEEILFRLNGLYSLFKSLQNQGYPVDAIAPMGAIYLTVKFNLIDKISPTGKILKTGTDISNFLIEEAGFAVVPFKAFGAENMHQWFRISIGTLKKEDIPFLENKLKKAIDLLK